MNVILCNNRSEANIINKTITDVITKDCTIKGNISHETPVIILQYDSTNIGSINYMKIPELGRCYFINELIDLTGGRYEIHGKVDVLESFKSQILGLSCIIDKTQSDVLSNMYLNDGSFVSMEKEYITSKNFPTGFTDDGQFILITAGGIAAT